MYVYMYIYIYITTRGTVIHVQRQHTSAYVSICLNTLPNTMIHVQRRLLVICVYVNVCMHACMHACLCMYVCMYMCVCVCVCLCFFFLLCVCITALSIVMQVQRSSLVQYIYINIYIYRCHGTACNGTED
jgi:hypothetical protein